jgi:hypothetical protein
LFENPTAIYNMARIRKYRRYPGYYWYRNSLAYNKAFINNEKIIDSLKLYKEFKSSFSSFRYDPEYNFRDFIADTIWDTKIILKYSDYYPDHFYEQISRNTLINWTEEFIDKLSSKLHWGILAKNESIPWSEKMIDKYIDHLEDYYVFPQKITAIYYLLKKVDHSWTEESIAKYAKIIDWRDFSINPPKLTMRLLKRFETAWEWDLLSRNNDIEIIKEFLDESENHS